MIEVVDLEITFFQCSAGHKFCGRCKTAGWHKKGKCNDVLIFLLNFQYIKSVLKQIKKDKLNDAINFKQCPNCEIIIEKDEGCNHMTCVSCNHQFCWLCMEKYTNDHFAIYNVRGCPGMRFGIFI